MEKEICWNITARCNQNCKYCHRFLNVQELTFEENEIILNKLINSGVTSITWTGGEALLVEGLDELLKKSFEKGIKNKIITNGKLLTNERIDKIYKYLDSVTLSIDSINDQVNHDLGRGKNHYNEIKNILDYLKNKEIDLKIRINSVVCKNNCDNFENLVNFLNNYNIYSWRIFKFMPLREKAITNKNIFDISMDEYHKVVEVIKNSSNCSNIDTRVIEDMEKKYVLILANGNIVITDNGEDKIVGNALNDDFSRIIS